MIPDDPGNAAEAEDDWDLDVSVISPPGDLAFAVEATEVAPEEVDWTESSLEGERAGSAAVRIGRGQVGVRESGGENRGVPYERYVKYFGRGLPPSPWCAFFVSWCFAQSGTRPPWANPGYVPSVHQWASAHNRLVAAPAHGDMFGIAGEHMGLVAGANPAAGQIYSVEGNWEDCVLCRLINYRGSGMWFARL